MAGVPICNFTDIRQLEKQKQWEVLPEDLNVNLNVNLKMGLQNQKKKMLRQVHINMRPSKFFPCSSFKKYEIIFSESPDGEFVQAKWFCKFPCKSPLAS